MELSHGQCMISDLYATGPEQLENTASLSDQRRSYPPCNYSSREMLLPWYSQKGTKGIQVQMGKIFNGPWVSCFPGCFSNDKTRPPITIKVFSLFIFHHWLTAVLYIGIYPWSQSQENICMVSERVSGSRMNSVIPKFEEAEKSSYCKTMSSWDVQNSSYQPFIIANQNPKARAWLWHRRPTTHCYFPVWLWAMGVIITSPKVAFTREDNVYKVLARCFTHSR